MSRWKFVERVPGMKNREAMQGEFFSDSSIDNDAQALIREAIQNSLDARLNNNIPVRVRIYLSKEEDALTAKEHNKYFSAESWLHFQAEYNGLKNAPASEDLCNYLVYEDFNTTGLTGDISAWDVETGESNPFYYFFRAEGQSGKSGTERGRWGIGKFVFPKASRIRAFFGLTVRADDKKWYLAGQSILRSHRVNGKPYSPDGWYGNVEGQIDLPTDDLNIISNFCEVFRVSRKDSESGLSVIIPFCSTDIERDHILSAVVKEYFFAILNLDLEISIETPSSKLELKASNILEEIAKVDVKEVASISPYISLASWYRDLPDEEVIILQPPDINKRVPKWSESMLDKNTYDVINQRLEKGDAVAVKVPITIQFNDEGKKDTYFHILMKRDTNDKSGKPLFIREGIIISDVRSQRARGIVSMVICNDEPIAEMLGDAENPAHTQWQENSENFRGKYKNGRSYLGFVSRSVAKLNELISGRNEKEDKTLLMDIFSVTAPEDMEDIAETDKKKKTVKRQGQETEIDTNDIPPPKPRNYRLSRIKGGFMIRGSDRIIDEPIIFDVRVAYGTRTGNPIKKYSVNDFDFSAEDSEVIVEYQDLEDLLQNENQIKFKALDNKFRLTVTGFDPHRDLIVVPRTHKEQQNETI